MCASKLAQSSHKSYLFSEQNLLPASLLHVSHDGFSKSSTEQAGRRVRAHGKDLSTKQLGHPALRERKKKDRTRKRVRGFDKFSCVPGWESHGGFWLEACSTEEDRSIPQQEKKNLLYLTTTSFFRQSFCLSLYLLDVFLLSHFLHGSSQFPLLIVLPLPPKHQIVTCLKDGPLIEAFFLGY